MSMCSSATRTARRFRDESKRIGFTWSLGFLFGYVAAMLDRGKTDEKETGNGV